MDPNFWSPVIITLEVAIVSGVLTIVSGLFFGKLMSRKKFRGKSVIETLFLLPLVLPPTVVGFLLIVLFGKLSPLGRLIDMIFSGPVIFTWWAAVIASSVVAFPLMYQSARAGFEVIEEDIEHAARVDGASELTVFLSVTIPLAYRQIVSGAVLSFARALGEFGATLMFAGNIPGKTQTVPTAIYMAIDSGNMELAWSWVLCMIGISFLMLMGVQLLKT